MGYTWVLCARKGLGFIAEAGPKHYVYVVTEPVVNVFYEL